MNTDSKKLVLHLQLRCGSLSITLPVSHVANEFDVRSDLHGQMSLADEAMNVYKNLKIH